MALNQAGRDHHSNGAPSSKEAPTLTAYHTSGPEIDIVPAARWRDWMDGTYDRWANRCLPLLMANESGWSLLNPHGFTATWDGGSLDSSLMIQLDQPPPRHGLACSIFGYGIITWGVPYLFKTDPGWNLLARGPVNDPKDGVGPLEGLVETDWATAKFTMNWKMTRPGLPVRFEAGEPFCTIVPQRRYELESFEPRKGTITDDPELEHSFQRWQRNRDQNSILQFVSQYGKVDGFDELSWERDYFRGRSRDGHDAPDHQTKRRLKPFGQTQ